MADFFNKILPLLNIHYGGELFALILHPLVFRETQNSSLGWSDIFIVLCPVLKINRFLSNLVSIVGLPIKLKVEGIIKNRRTGEKLHKELVLGSG